MNVIRWTRMRGAVLFATLCLTLIAGFESRGAFAEAQDPGPPGPAPPEEAAATGGPVDDDYLRGYIVSYLEQTKHLGPDRVRVDVKDGVVTLTGAVPTPEEIDRIVAAVVSFAGVERLINRLEVEDTSVQRHWRAWTEWLRPPPGRKTVRFPSGDLFTPPLADQKQPRFHTTWQRWHTDSGTFDIASVGFGENFGLVRWPRGRGEAGPAGAGGGETGTRHGAVPAAGAGAGGRRRGGAETRERRVVERQDSSAGSALAGCLRVVSCAAGTDHIGASS